jgi:protein-S-isoprenylcysteine O-methyltransferase Ste14
MNGPREIDKSESANDGPLPGLLRPPILFLAAIVSGIALNHVWALPFVPKGAGWLGSTLGLCAGLLFLLSCRAFWEAGTPVRGNKRTTVIVRTGPYRFGRNPIYLSFILLVLGLSIWLNDLWLLIALLPAIGVIAAIVVPREEQFLERNFGEQYSSYKASVPRWL